MGVEGEDVVGDTDTEVGEPHGHDGALVAGLHLTEEIVLATDGHRDLLGGAGRLGLGEGDDIVAEAFGERGLAVFEVDMEVEVVVALRLFIGLLDEDGVALSALQVFPLVDPVEAARRLGVLVEDPHGEEEFVFLVFGKGVDLSFHDGDDSVLRLDRHLVFDTIGMAHRLGTFPQQEGDLVGDLSLEADDGEEKQEQGKETAADVVHGAFSFEGYRQRSNHSLRAARGVPLRTSSSRARRASRMRRWRRSTSTLETAYSTFLGFRRKASSQS